MNNMAKYTMVPAVRTQLLELAGLAKATALIGTTLSAVVDNSTGTGDALVAINVRRTRFTHVNAASDLITKAAFDAAVTKSNNAIAVLKGLVNEIAAVIDPDVALTGGDGTVAVAGTVPAQDKTITASDGATAVAQDRAGFNTAVINIRNNLSTITTAVNRLSNLFGLSRLTDMGEGTSIGSRALANKAAGTTAIDNTGDAVPKTAADEAFTAMATNIHVLATKIDAIQDHIADIAPGLEPAA